MSVANLVKIVLGVVFALVMVAVSGAIAHGLVAPRALDKNVYVVDTSSLAAPAAQADAGKTAQGEPKMAAVQGPGDILPMLAKADIAAGQKTARACAACHSFGKGEAAKVGPNLYGIVGNKHAHMAGFAYSDAMKSMKDHEWDYDELNQFIYKPKAHLPGTKMGFAGLPNDQDRANVIAWLRTLADKPVPLP